MAQFNHANIGSCSPPPLPTSSTRIVFSWAVKLIGVCLEPEAEPTLIVLEYMHLGSLHSYLQRFFPFLFRLPFS
jgi:hypothetical protein